MKGYTFDSFSLDICNQSIDEAMKTIKATIDKITKKGAIKIEFDIEPGDYGDNSPRLFLIFERLMTKKEIKSKQNNEHYYAEQEKVQLRKLYKKYGKETL